MNKSEWKNIYQEVISNLGIIELGDNGYFEVVQTEDYLIFGNSTNTGLMQSGYMLIDDCFSLDENLACLIDDLFRYYSTDYAATEFIVCNERM